MREPHSNVIAILIIIGLVMMFLLVYWTAAELAQSPALGPILQPE